VTTPFTRAVQDQVLGQLRRHPSYRAWGRGVGLRRVGGRDVVVVAVQQPAHAELAHGWVGSAAFGVPILVEAVGDFHALADDDVGDLLAYRQQWEPFIAAHLALWRDLNSLLESIPDAQQCPPGIFTVEQINPSLRPGMRAFCASLALTRIRTSDTNPGGILPQWNAWAGKSSADILAGAASMLQWHQHVVLDVGGPYKDDLVQIAKLWKQQVDLPPVPSFSAQQDLVARIEASNIAAKGILQIVGYAAGQTLQMAGNLTQAVAEGLSETARAIPKIVKSPWTWIAVTAVAILAGGALVAYYVPRRRLSA
jgi:hypothetical protein